MVSASRIFDCLARNNVVCGERHVVAKARFSNLRSSLRRMAAIYHEADDPEASDGVGYIQRTLSEWLTVPVPFDEALAEKLALLGTPELLERRWGEDLGNLCRVALDAAQQLCGSVNPLADLVGRRICQLQAEHQDFRVFCHRAAVPVFNELVIAAGGHALAPAAFLHSWRDYRECDPFGVLIKVGPLRARGWGAVPDAIITAPRFARLVQFVWSGCHDEPEFGYDPVISSAASRSASEHGTSTSLAPAGVSWTTHEHRSADEDDVAVLSLPDADEFQMFRDLRDNSARESRHAILIQIDDEHGMLYPPLARVLCFDPARPDKHCIGYRIAGDSLHENSFVIRPALQTDGGGTLQAQHGRFSQIWKSRLRKRLQENPDALIRELNAAGLNLMRLESALHHWMKPPTTVIHAPQQKKHFEILVRVLQADFSPVAPAYFRGKPLWQFAWQEVCHSRGEAIHAGVVSHAQEEERLCEVLRSMIPDLRGMAAGGTSFTVQLPDGNAVSGAAFFDRVMAIEDGFRAPDQALRVAHDLNEAEQWRV